MSDMQVDLSKLTTEQQNENSIGIDSKSIEEIIDIFNAEDRKVIDAVIREKQNIAKAIGLIVDSFQNGGRLIYVGAGTSGRLGVMDAAECPPTFGVDRDMVQAIIAGGSEALTRSIERAEDSAEEGAFAIRARNVTEKDVVVGIATSGRTPFVIGALKEAKRLGAKTVFIMCNQLDIELPFIDLFILPIVGPEIIAGSTRLKAGTATKMILNMLTTISMIKTGKVYDNLMVDVQVWNEKLLDRAKRLVMKLGNVDDETAEKLLKEAHGKAKVAIVMARVGCDYRHAIELLNNCNGFLRKIIG